MLQLTSTVRMLGGGLSWVVLNLAFSLSAEASPLNLPIPDGSQSSVERLEPENSQVSESSVQVLSQAATENLVRLEQKDIKFVQTQGALRGGEESRLPFSLKNASNLTLNLFGLEANINVSLEDGNGNPIAESSNPDRSPEMIAASLAAGEYVVTLKADAAGSPYVLSAAAIENNPLKSPTFAEYVIPSVATDSRITDPKGPHYGTIDLAVQPQGKLFIFLPGTNGSPLSYRLIAQQAAALGYHAIGLAYPNEIAVTSRAGCGLSQNPNCAANLRLEIADGTNRSDQVSITPANSINNRLIQVLRYLALQYPEQGWSTFLADGEVLWDRVVLAGHSQGGGHAAIIAKYRELAGAVLFAPELDYSTVFNDFAPWVGKDSLTPVENYYAFQHEEDPIFPLRRQLRAFSRLGMDAFGPAVNVDQSSPPFNDSRQLVTSATPQIPGAEHGSVVIDAATPVLPNGEPLYAEVWEFVLRQEP